MTLDILDLGLVEFNTAYQIQKNIVNDVKIQKTNDTLILCEHPPVITLGRRANSNNILASKELLEQEGIQIINTDRGGDVTYHGPGQLVVYPIINLEGLKKDISFFLRLLEKILIGFLTCYRISAYTKDRSTGVWAGKDKIASIGIGIRKWIAYHGLAINLNTNLSHFSFIKPCGLNTKMTSMQKILNKSIDIKKSKLIIIDKFNFYLRAEREKVSKNEAGNFARIG